MFTAYVSFHDNAFAFTAKGGIQPYVTDLLNISYSYLDLNELHARFKLNEVTQTFILKIFKEREIVLCSVVDCMFNRPEYENKSFQLITKSEANRIAGIYSQKGFKYNEWESVLFSFFDIFGCEYNTGINVFNYTEYCMNIKNGIKYTGDYCSHFYNSLTYNNLPQIDLNKVNSVLLTCYELVRCGQTKVLTIEEYNKFVNTVKTINPLFMKRFTFNVNSDLVYINKFYDCILDLNPDTASEVTEDISSGCLDRLLNVVQLKAEKIENDRKALALINEIGNNFSGENSLTYRIQLSAIENVSPHIEKKIIELLIVKCLS